MEVADGIGRLREMSYGLTMNRRNFGKFAIGSMGLALLPRALAADPLPAPSQPSTPPSKTALLARARASLDRHHDEFALRDRVALADFSVASHDLRFHIVDLIGGSVSSYLVAHGKGSDPAHSGFLQSFSNEPDSRATSAGAYKTGEIYDGEHGQSMRLLGLDPANNNAEPRAIVIHGAWYVSENQIATWGKIGRSEGCFAVAEHMIPQVLGLIGPGRMLYADKV